jgi:hypothetical protein
LVSIADSAIRAPGIPRGQDIESVALKHERQKWWD